MIAAAPRSKRACQVFGNWRATCKLWSAARRAEHRGSSGGRWRRGCLRMQFLICAKVPENLRRGGPTRPVTSTSSSAYRWRAPFVRRGCRWFTKWDCAKAVLGRPAYSSRRHRRLPSRPGRLRAVHRGRRASFIKAITIPEDAPLIRCYRGRPLPPHPATPRVGHFQQPRAFRSSNPPGHHVQSSVTSATLNSAA